MYISSISTLSALCASGIYIPPFWTIKINRYNRDHQDLNCIGCMTSVSVLRVLCALCCPDAF
nr:MAG TPA: hypothetical protein [Caudoviricetes sp.]